MTRRISLAVLCLFLCAGSAGAAAPKADATPGWKTASDYLAKNALLPYAKGDGPVTRAELAAALVALTGSATDPKAANCFKDVAKESFAPAVCLAGKNKWIEAEKDGTFQPSSPATFGVAVKAIVRAQKFGAKATRGSWYVPFVTAAVKEGIIDKADYDSVIGEDVQRGELAAMLYRVLLRQNAVSYGVDVSCVPAVPVSVTVAQTGTAGLQDTAIVVSDAAGKTCTVAHDPLARSDAKHPKLELTPLVPLIANSNEGPKTPLVDGVAYFLSKDGDLWAPYVWKLDLKKKMLTQVMNAEAPGAIRISPRYTFLAYVTSKGVDLRAMNLKTGLSKAIRQLTTRVSFLKAVTQSRKVTNTDHIYIDENEMMTYEIYNMHDSSLFQGNIHAKLDELFYPSK